jgi:hypothetical protein
MLASMGTKGGTILYHIRYGGYCTTLGCLAISGVIGCCQPKCWLTNVGLVTKLDCGQIFCIGTPTCVIGVFSTASCKTNLDFLINNFSLSSTKGQFLNSCPTC